MSMHVFERRTGSDGTGLRAVRRHICAMQRLAGQGATLALLCIVCSAVPNSAIAQVGQAPMAPAGGLLGSAASGVQRLNTEGPGILYYGINGADRGLGYRGSYMTLGGFIPAVEDDLGGLWSADMRGHLSTYGGFFSNFGAVRKQFIGGSLLGVGVYWDYDGDMNQYPDTPVAGTTYVFPGGQVYNQVGVSGEWLTDWGNIRSNGYIPVGSTAQLVGPFLQNAFLCENGVNAALGGADFELGAYIPGLSDWAGMVSVGGYALGNTRYTFPNGTGAVPWFGGVYTRLDMTFIENWDFSLQANNDSYFDWTGFARLTYRMGGSRRRNVPDQMEQPMMRNEHIVRAHQVPEVALNPNNLDSSGNPLPWRLYHVNNTAAPGGNGTVEQPFSTLGDAMARPVNSPYDIVYVQVGDSGVAPYVTPVGGFMFGAANQFLVGQGSTLAIPTVSCGNLAIFSTPGSTSYPTIFNPIGPAVVLNQPGATVNHISIVNSPVGISDAAGPPVASASVSDVFISGNGGTTLGIQIANSTGAFSFDNVRMSNLTNGGLLVSAANANVSLNNSSLTSISGTAVAVTGAAAVTNLTGNSIDGTIGTAVEAAGAGALVTFRTGTISATAGDAIVSSGSAALVQVNSSLIQQTGGSALEATGEAAAIRAIATRIDATGNPAIRLTGTNASVTIDSSAVTDVTGDGVLISASRAVFTMQNRSSLTDVTGDGISILSSATNAFAQVINQSSITAVGGSGIRTDGAGVRLYDSTISQVAESGIFAENVTGTSAVWVQGSLIANAVDSGITAINSNLRVEQLDPTVPTSTSTRITNTGLYGVRILADTRLLPAGSAYLALVDHARIAGAQIGISAQASTDLVNPLPTPPPLPNPPDLSIPIIDLTVTNNQIIAAANSISLSAVFDGSFGFPGRPLSRVNATITENTLTTTGTEDILLTTAGDPTTFTTLAGPVTAPAVMLPLQIAAGSQTQLGNLNGRARVAISPANSRPNFDAALVPAQPPAAPPLP